MQRRGEQMEEEAYGLKWNPNPPIRVANLVTYAVAAGLYTILAFLGVIAVPAGVLGVSGLYFGMGFLIPFVLWFSGWGVLIGVIGAILGAGIFQGMPIPQSIAFGSVEALVQIPMLVVYRLVAPPFGLSPIGRDVFTAKGFVFFLVWPAIVTQLWSAVSGMLALYLLNIVPRDILVPEMIAWWIGNVIAVVVIGTMLCGLLAPVVERLGLTVQGIIT
jgi:hypothetical protein